MTFAKTMTDGVILRLRSGHASSDPFDYAQGRLKEREIPYTDHLQAKTGVLSPSPRFNGVLSTLPAIISVKLYVS